MKCLQYSYNNAKIAQFLSTEVLKLKINQIITTLFIGLVLCVSNIYAEDVVAKLNKDWKNIHRTDCKLGAPDYYCSGIIAHVFDDDSFLYSSNHQPYPWSSNGKGFISFSYLRQDILVNDPLYTAPGIIDAGYILTPIANLTHSPQYTLLCEYPIDGATDERAEEGCAPTCKSVVINTSDEYVKNVVHEPKTMCSASPDQAGFKMMLDTINKLKANPPPYLLIAWNELVIQEWSNKDNKNFPIEAFFYEIKNNTFDPKAKAAAVSAAKLYHDATGIDVPVVAVDVKKLSLGDDAPFSN